MLCRIFVICIYLVFANEVAAQTSASITNSDKQSAYERLKTLYLKHEAATGRYIPVHTGAKDVRSLKEVNLYDCVGAMGIASGRDKRTASFMNLIYATTSVRMILPDAGYPKSVWESGLDNFEKQMLKRIGEGKDEEFLLKQANAYFKRLTSVLDDYRRKSIRKIPRVYWDLDCGGHGITIKLQSNPRGAKIYLISRLMKEYCTDIGIDSDDIDKCREWESVAPGEDIMVSGDKIVQAIWASAIGFRSLLIKNLKDDMTYSIVPR